MTTYVRTINYIGDQLRHNLISQNEFELNTIGAVRTPLNRNNPRNTTTNMQDRRRSRQLNNSQLRNRDTPALNVNVHAEDQQVARSNMVLNKLSILPEAVLNRMLGLPDIQSFRAALQVIDLDRINPRLNTTLIGNRKLARIMLNMRTILYLTPEAPSLIISILVVHNQPDVVSSCTIIRLTFNQ